jgi:aspartate/methionine/tyrosine aminotransferase
MIEKASRLNQAETYYFAKKLAEIRAMNAQGMDIINLGIGSPDLPPPDEVTAALTAALQEKDAHQYQAYKGIPDLCKAFADWYHTHFHVTIDPSTQVLPLIGSKEGVMHIAMTFLNEGDEVLVPNPGYPSYSMTTKLAGGVVRNFELKEELNWLPDLEALDKEDLSKVKLMWINYPNMPTGGNANLDFYEQLVAFAKKHNILICHDNPYTFILNDNPINIFQIDGAMDVALELTSVSKNYNMAGWRVGAVTGQKAYIDEILKFKSNMDSGMFKPVQRAAIAALGMGQDWFDYLNDIYIKRKVIASQILEASGCKIASEGAGMFVWASIPDQYSKAEDLSEILLQQGRVFITPGHIFGDKGERYLRISLCSDEDTLYKALDRVSALQLTPKPQTVS